jgi:hypothetical protein
VDELRRCRRRRPGQIAALHEHHGKTATGGIPGDSDAVDSATDD